MKVNDRVLIGGFGDYADFQHIMKLLNQQSIDDAVIGMIWTDLVGFWEAWCDLADCGWIW